MNGLFSQKLTNEAITVFREEDGIELSIDQANQCLQRLSGLFLAFAPVGVLGLPDQGHHRLDIST